MAEVTLFLTAFLAATILPFSSEAAFLVALSNDMPVVNAMLSASSGNILATVVNYYLGYFLYEKTKTKLLSSKVGIASYRYGHKYGYFALLLSWLPIVGDPLTIVAGLVRLKFVWFVLIVATLRVARYYFLTLML
ncbi:MAG: VTT domain-containing protein [Campylobacterota bacterium]|nr:VTT domain-containing protein [Campylobacterota bacterium]